VGLRTFHLAIGFLGLAAACTSRTPAGGPVRITDDAGRAVALARPAQRIVSLSPSFTEILFAIGAGDRVVGRTAWCDYPEAAAAIPSVGDGLPPNVEAVAARRPDLVVMYRSPATETAAQQLEGLGIPTALLRVDVLADAARAARLLGVLTGQGPSGDSVGDAIAAVESARPPATSGAQGRPSVAFIVWDNPIVVIGRGSYLHELAERAGARNAFGDLDVPSAEVSLEALAARKPDALVFLTPPPAPVLALSSWRVVPAVRERRLIHLVGSVYGRPSPRADQAVAGFRAALDSVLAVPR
jgi:ABC-type Fe3+-hydroxamate transport system substrate-binding protein